MIIRARNILADSIDCRNGARELARAIAESEVNRGRGLAPHLAVAGGGAGQPGGRTVRCSFGSRTCSPPLSAARTESPLAALAVDSALGFQIGSFHVDVRCGASTRPKQLARSWHFGCRLSSPVRAGGASRSPPAYPAATSERTCRVPRTMHGLPSCPPAPTAHQNNLIWRDHLLSQD